MSRRHAPRLAVIAMAALALTGCGEDPGIETGSVPFKGTDTSSLEPLRSDMVKNMQKQSYAKKAGDDGKPSAGSAEAGGPSPAGESKTQAQPKPATKGG